VLQPVQLASVAEAANQQAAVPAREHDALMAQLIEMILSDQAAN
jgi:hypothetical protein